MAAPLTAEDLYEYVEVTDVAVSPDGTRVAYVRDEFDEPTGERRSSLFVVAADGSNEPRRLTRAGGARDPAWSPGGNRLGFIDTREPERGSALEGDHGTARGDHEPQVWAFDMDRGGDAERLTHRSDGVSEFDWGPDGDRLVVAARDPIDEEREYLDQRETGGPIEIERLQHKYDGSGWLDEVTTYLFVVETATGDETRLDHARDRSTALELYGMVPRWRPDGDGIAFLSSKDGDPDDSFVRDVYTVSPAGDDESKVTDSDLLVSALSWNPTGEYLGFVGRNPNTWYDPPRVHVREMDAERNRTVSGSLDRTVAWPETLRWLDERTVVTMIGDEGRTRFAGFGVDSTHERLFDRQPSHRTVERFDVRGGTLAACLSGPDTGGDVYATDAESLRAETTDLDSFTRATRANELLLDGADLPNYRRLTFTSDGYGIAGHFFYPPSHGDDPDRLPLVVQIHGGPQSYDAPRFEFDRACLIGEGYAVVSVDYRGSTSYGREFCRTLRGRWDDVEVSDVLAGVDEVVDRGWADPDRLFVTGFSYGGTATARLILGNDRFVAAVPEHGVYDRRSCFGTDDAHIWWGMEYGLPWENEAIYDEGSIVVDADGIDTPTLVMAGADDHRCPSPQAEQLYVSLRKQGVPAKLVIYPGEHHDVGDPDRAIHRIEQIVGWFDRFDPATGARSY